MARARNIKPGLFENEILGVEDPFLTILFCGLWCLADRKGRLENRPLRIKAEIFPYREKLDINGYLTELERLGFIRTYSCNDLSVIEVLNFNKHQNPHKTEKNSELPEYTDSCVLTVKEPLINGSCPADSLIPDSLIPDSLIPETSAKPSKKENPFLLPDWINQSDWDMWMKTRKGKKMIPLQMMKQVHKLKVWKDSGQDYAGALEAAAINGYTGLFLPDNKASPPKRKQKFCSTELDYGMDGYGNKINGEGNGRIIDIN